MTAPADLERRGRVDAVIRLVLSRRFPLLDAADWCQLLDVTPDEVRAELERRRRAHLRPVDDQHPATCPTCGKRFRDARGVAACERAHQPPVPCPICGRPTNPAGLARHVTAAHPARKRKR